MSLQCHGHHQPIASQMAHPYIFLIMAMSVSASPVRVASESHDLCPVYYSALWGPESLEKLENARSLLLQSISLWRPC